MRTPRRRAYALLASAVGLSGLALTGGSAGALHNSEAPCLVITEDTTLTGDLGPCSGHGIVVAADNITLDLGGFTVSGKQTPMEQAGIYLENVSGVTVKNGIVTGFDAGVAIEGGGGNTVTGITATGNVNDMMEPIDPRSIVIDWTTGPTPQQMHDISLVTCDFGDGITVFDSSNNIITGNTATENGPYSGISLVGDSDNNTVSGNQVHENDLLNKGVVDEEGNTIFVDSRRFLDQAETIRNPDFGRHVDEGAAGATEPASMCGATEVGTPGMGRGREVQSSGIRIEGPGADENLVDGNTVTKSGLAGISIHSYVKFPAADFVPAQDPNRNNVVSNNSVSLTGADTHTVDSFADGIAILSSGPVGTITFPSDTNTIVGNTSFDNYRHGISLGRLTFGNTIDKNVVTGNGGSGVWVAEGAHDNDLTRNKGRGNAKFDGADLNLNPPCDENQWKANNFRTFNQPCVVPGGSGKAPGRGGTGAGNSADAPGGVNRPAR